MGTDNLTICDICASPLWAGLTSLANLTSREDHKSFLDELDQVRLSNPTMWLDFKARYTYIVGNRTSARVIVVQQIPAVWKSCPLSRYINFLKDCEDGLELAQVDSGKGDVGVIASALSALVDSARISARMYANGPVRKNVLRLALTGIARLTDLFFSLQMNPDALDLVSLGRLLVEVDCPLGLSCKESHLLAAFGSLGTAPGSWERDQVAGWAKAFSIRSYDPTPLALQ